MNVVRRIIGPLAIALLLVAGLLIGFVRDFSGDFHWHVALGDFMLSHGELARTDTFSHTFAGQPQALQSWLADVTLALAFRARGYAGCYLLRALCVAGLLALLCREMVRCGISAATAAALLALALGELCFRLYLRPETFTLLLFGALLALIGEHERTGKRGLLAIALGVLLLWANLHASVAMGLLAVGLYAAQLTLRALFARPRDRKQIALGLALPPLAILVTLVNPEGLLQPQMPLAIASVDPVCVPGPEWLPLPLATASPTVQVAAFAILATTLLAGRRTSAWRLVLVLALALLTLRYQRFVKGTLIAAAPLVAVNLAALRARLEGAQLAHKWRTAGALLVLGAAALGLSTLLVTRNLFHEVGLGLDPGAYPEQACRFAREARPAGRMLNSYDIGSYLLHCLPEQPVFVDGRSCTVYTKEFLHRYYDAGRSREALQTLAEDYRIGWAMLVYDPIAQRMASAPATWRLVYFDDLALIYVRKNDPEQARLAERGFTHLDPSRLAQLPRLAGPALDAAKEELGRQTERCPSCFRTLLARAGVEIASAEWSGFERTLGLLLARGERPETVFLAAAAALTRGDRDKAEALFARFRQLSAGTGRPQSRAP